MLLARLTVLSTSRVRGDWFSGPTSHGATLARPSNGVNGRLLVIAAVSRRKARKCAGRYSNHIANADHTVARSQETVCGRGHRGRGRGRTVSPKGSASANTRISTPWFLYSALDPNRGQRTRCPDRKVHGFLLPEPAESPMPAEVIRIRTQRHTMRELQQPALYAYSRSASGPFSVNRYSASTTHRPLAPTTIPHRTSNAHF